VDDLAFFVITGLFITLTFESVTDHLYLIVINCEKFHQNISIHPGDRKVKDRRTDIQLHGRTIGQSENIIPPAPF